MANPFQPVPGESILYHSQLTRKWYDIAWRIGLAIFELAVFMLFSFTAFTSLANSLLATFLPVALADALSRIIFQDIVPILVIAWSIEDTARIFTSDLVLTNQRVWTKGYPYAWNPGREILISDIKFMSSHRDALFIHLKSSKKTQVHVVPDSKGIVKAFTQFTGRIDQD
jgi:hypothetical protein